MSECCCSYENDSNSSTRSHNFRKHSTQVYPEGKLQKREPPFKQKLLAIQTAPRPTRVQVRESTVPSQRPRWKLSLRNPATVFQSDIVQHCITLVAHYTIFLTHCKIAELASLQLSGLRGQVHDFTLDIEIFSRES